MFASTMTMVIPLENSCKSGVFAISSWQKADLLVAIVSPFTAQMSNHERTDMLASQSDHRHIARNAINIRVSRRMDRAGIGSHSFVLSSFHRWFTPAKWSGNHRHLYHYFRLSRYLY